MAAGALLLCTITAALVTCIYVVAYIGTATGLFIVFMGAIALDVATVAIGFGLAGFGGFVYIEWIADDPGGLPSLYEAVTKR